MEYKWHFIVSLIIVSCIAILGFASLSYSYHNRLDRIEEIQMADCRHLYQVLNNSSLNRNTFRVELEKVSEAFKRHEDRMQSLLELEFDKLQNDFNFISLWAGLITIVFLIFSIYSIFKTDEMLKKSENAYDEIKRNSTEIEKFADDIKKEYTNELDTLKKEADDFVKEFLQKLALLNERFANIDSQIKSSKESLQADETIQASTEELVTQEPNS